MPGSKKRTVSLAAAQVSYIDALVKSGTYASASEVAARAAGARCRGRTLAARGGGADLRRYLQADPGRGLSADQITAALAAHHAGRLKKTGRDA